MSKTLTVREFAAVKRVAMNVSSLVVKKNKIAAKINELNAEFNALIDEIEGHEEGVKKKTNGLTSEDLVVKKVEDTGKVDKDGKPIKKTVYEPNENTVVFNEDLNVYEIKSYSLPTEEVSAESIDDTEMAPEVEVQAGEDAPIDPTSYFVNTQN